MNSMSVAELVAARRYTASCIVTLRESLAAGADEDATTWEISKLRDKIDHIDYALEQQWEVA